MKKLPKIHLSVSPAWQKERLGLWLLERKIDLQMGLLPVGRKTSREGQSVSVEGTQSIGWADFRNFISDTRGKAVGAGQIRLMMPPAELDSHGPLYMALIREWDEDQFLVAPFARYSEPATTGEVLTGRATPCLRVLCLWNARTIPVAQLASSWFVDSLSKQEMADFWSVFRHVAVGVPVPLRLEKRIGPPILNPADPRLEYQAEEVERVDGGLVGAVAETQVSVSRVKIKPPGNVIFLHIPWGSKYEEEGTLALAAKSKSIFRAQSAFKVLGRNLYLHVSPHSDWRQFVCLIVDGAGEPSNALNGARLIGKGGAASDPIVGAQTVAGFAVTRDGFVMMDPNGKALKLALRK